MKQVNKYWTLLKRKSPKILAIAGSIGTGVTAYLAAKNEAAYQHKRFDYYIENGYFPEEYGGIDQTKEELRNKAYRILGTHLKQHWSTFVSGGLTIASILTGNAAGEKQKAALVAMNIGIGNMIAKRNDVQEKIVEENPKEKSEKISKEDIQDYLIREAYDNDLVYYTSIEDHGEDEEFLWLDVFPSNKIFIVKKNDVNGLEWFINTSLKEQNYVSYGEIFDYLNIYSRIPLDFVDEDINEWIYMFGFSRKPDDFSKIEVYTREVIVDEGVTVTALTFSSIGNVIQMM